ncbi:right-handed parallel beta-helix repeat-containing protein [Lentzea sp. NEAU-D13]|uniref:Right-handed parallel beta-helix repeat-containing protein n=1 Tax=Lentzea alba TaxID=2714351 RepID=A0A7C9RXE1_9PSEU|nr:right-handed parallel beta-helix repeat-containing protein [Lentzea alba]
MPRAVLAIVFLSASTISSPASADTGVTAYYVSATGDDSNAGTSPRKAWRSLEKVNATTFKPGERILLRSGDSWTGRLWPKGSGAAGRPVVVNRFGMGHKPRIVGGGQVGEAVRLFNQEHWEIRNLDVSNAAPAGSVPGVHLADFRGIAVLGDNGRTLNHFLIDSVDVHDVTGDIRWIGGNPANNTPGVTWGTGWDRSKNTGGIVFRTTVPDIAAPGAAPTVLNDITVQNSTVKNTSFANIAVKQYTGDAPGAVRTGWGERRTADDTRFRPHTNVTIRGNYLSQGGTGYGGNGVYLTNVRGALVERNVVKQVAVSGIETYAADQVTVQYNEISGTRHAQGSADANGLDPDIATTNQLFQYNYLHENGDGILLCACRDSVNFGSAVVRYNVVTGSKRWNLHVAQSTGSYAQVYHNTFYSNEAPNMVSGYANGRVEIRNNLFASGVAASFVQGANLRYEQNGYSTGLVPSAGDLTAVTGEPRFRDPAVSGPYGDERTGPRLKTARGFALNRDSLFADAATLVIDRGGRDYLGAPVATPANLGAFDR